MNGDAFDLLRRLVESLSENDEGGFNLDEDVLREAAILVGHPGLHRRPGITEPRLAAFRRWLEARDFHGPDSFYWRIFDDTCEGQALVAGWHRMRGDEKVAQSEWGQLLGVLRDALADERLAI